MSLFKHAHPYPCTAPNALHVAWDLPHDTEWENRITESLGEGYSKKKQNQKTTQLAELFRSVHRKDA